jgi:hypothetical protein
MNINESQTPEFRRFKYKKLIEAGAPICRAKKIRDWNHMACIAEIARLRRIDRIIARQYFFKDLESSGIKLWRDTPIKHVIPNKEDKPACNQPTL